MSASPAATRAPREPRGSRFPLSFGRGAPLLLLAAFGALHWMELVDPPRPDRAWAATVIALAVTAALTMLARAPLRAARVGAAAVAVAATGLALLAAGVPDELLRPSRWPGLLDGLARGMEGIGGARVPYAGLEEWTRTTILLGGTAGPAAAALLAFWPRAGGRAGYRGAALVLLVALYATPAIGLVFSAEFARGVALALLVIAYLHLERVRIPDAAGALATAVACVVVALLAAPLLDRDQPWWDYETWATSAADSKSTTFSWEHDYGPLDWPRDGREVLRVKPRRPSYWKAENLDWFDGARWRGGMPYGMRERGAWGPQLPDDEEALDRWTQTIKVTVRNMRSRMFVTAGATLDVEMPRRLTLPMGAGTYTSTRDLTRGDAYTARVYTPQPTATQLRDAGTAYEIWLRWYRAIVIPRPERPREAADLRYRLLLVPSFKSEEPAVVDTATEDEAPRPAEAVIEDSALRRSWELARRLSAQSATPYGFAKRVEAHLRRGFVYTETPDPRARTLDGFLFDAREGYCQQFSGAMALLLRLGGVPARVATGFTAGREDEDTGEFVVRDLDAHSWVEAWFPGYGWVPFDPTPVDAPPSSQARGDRAPTAAIGDVTDLGAGDPLDPRVAASAQDDGLSAAAMVALIVLGGALGAVVALHRRRRALDGVDELERALRRAGAPLPAHTTLQGVERYLVNYPAAAAYVRAIRDARYGGHAAPAGPTPSQRRALREALSGDGALRRLRGWWALPPRRRRAPTRPSSAAGRGRTLA